MAYQRNDYYYRSKREGTRVVTEYVGRRQWVPALLRLGALERERQRSERARTRAEPEAELEVDREIDALDDLTRKLTQAVLIVSGYHTHNRQWRRQRDDDANRGTLVESRRHVAGARSL
jgi:hypothetical protein